MTCAFYFIVYDIVFHIEGKINYFILFYFLFTDSSLVTVFSLPVPTYFMYTSWISEITEKNSHNFNSLSNVLGRKTEGKYIFLFLLIFHKKSNIFYR